MITLKRYTCTKRGGVWLDVSLPNDAVIKLFANQRQVIYCYAETEGSPVLVPETFLYTEAPADVTNWTLIGSIQQNGRKFVYRHGR